MTVVRHADTFVAAAIHRATAVELLQHRWIIDSDVANVPLTSALTELRRFHARKKFKAAVHSVQAINSMNKAMSALSMARASGSAPASATAPVKNTEVSI